MADEEFDDENEFDDELAEDELDVEELEAEGLDEEGIAGGRGFRHHTFSTIRAAPCPTPTHMVARP